MSDRYYIDKSKTIRKSIIVYGVNGGLHSPVMYISKPKWISQEDFDELFSRMEIKIKGGNNE